MFSSCFIPFSFPLHFREEFLICSPHEFLGIHHPKKCELKASSSDFDNSLSLMSTFLFPSIHYPPLITLATMIIHLHQLILLLWFFFFSLLQLRQQQHRWGQTAVDSAMIWWNSDAERRAGGVEEEGSPAWRDGSLLIFIWVEYLNLAVIAARMLRREHVRKKEKWRGNKQVSESLRRLRINLPVSCPN